jgi:hypothetical protein
MDKEQQVNFSESLGADFLSGFIQELNMMPDHWSKMSEGQQNDVIDRLRGQVCGTISNIVKAIASDNRISASGVLDKVVIKDGAQATISFQTKAQGLSDLYEHIGSHVMVVVASPTDYLVGIEKIKGDSDQQDLEGVTECEMTGDVGLKIAVKSILRDSSVNVKE